MNINNDDVMVMMMMMMMMWWWQYAIHSRFHLTGASSERHKWDWNEVIKQRERPLKPLKVEMYLYCDKKDKKLWFFIIFDTGTFLLVKVLFALPWDLGRFFHCPPWPSRKKMPRRFQVCVCAPLLQMMYDTYVKVESITVLPCFYEICYRII